MNTVAGTTGYREVYDRFLDLSESIDFMTLHRCILHLIPEEPARILDIGAGSGRDAAAFAERGHAVTAVEPLPAFLAAASQLHKHDNISWLCDSYPDLAQLEPAIHTFDFILCHGVWQHLSPGQRPIAMARTFDLLSSGGVFAIALRHGPAGAGTFSFPATTDDTLALAEGAGFETALILPNQASAMPNKSHVQWTRLAFRRP